MKTISKFRIEEKWTFISGLTLLLTLIITWFFESYFAEIMFFMDYGAEDLAPNAKSVLLESVLTWERYIDSAMRYVVNFLPVFAVFPSMPFLQERSSYYVFGANRMKKYTWDIRKSILLYSVKSGITIAVTFTVFFLAGNFFLYPSISNIGGSASIFSENFYVNYPCLFFLFMTWTDYFAIGIAFGMMTCGFLLICNKEIYVVIAILFLYIAESYLGYLLDFLPLKLSESVCAFNTLYSTGEIFIPILTVIVFDVILIEAGLRKRRKFIDA